MNRADANTEPELDIEYCDFCGDELDEGWCWTCVSTEDEDDDDDEFDEWMEV